MFEKFLLESLRLGIEGVVAIFIVYLIVVVVRRAPRWLLSELESQA